MRVFDAARTFFERARILRTQTDNTYTYTPKPKSINLLGFFLYSESNGFEFFFSCLVASRNSGWVSPPLEKNVIRKIPWLWLYNMKMLRVRAQCVFISFFFSFFFWFRFASFVRYSWGDFAPYMCLTFLYTIFFFSLIFCSSIGSPTRNYMLQKFEMANWN